MGESFIGLRVWLSGSPWRLRPAWAVLAGALVAGATPWRQDDAVVLLLIVFLADALWGGVWNFLGGTVALVGGGAGEGVSYPLPYTQPASPSARLFAWLQGPAGHAWRDGIIALAWAFFLAGLINPGAMVLTGAVGGLSALTRGLPEPHRLRRVAAGLVTLGLPWALGMHLFGPWEPRGLILAGAFTLLVVWSNGVVQRAGVGLAHVMIVALLVIWRLPLAAGGTGLLLWAPTLWAMKGGSGSLLRRWAGPWWLAALLLAAWAVR
ncbi:MAG: hypothetical protein IT330_19320 [Anaerolineae bacterium]|nr:hypothetical protein [Anaerolineae bacterium]